ncbi:hypothetical protein HanRHA438_Chr05g0208711 [Helianthus annuus]|nr:hypothetical protein HanIR_Chr05g0214771 [Helianthus annuus]KAJ0917679.1 hypothetical protein HanRHA438_Chr05g0208711 [Helianthus annuus]
MDGDPFGYWDLLCDNLIPPEVFYKGVYYSFIGSGLYLTAEVFRREIGAPFPPYSPTTPIDKRFRIISFLFSQ